MGLFNHEHQLSQRRKKKVYNNPSTSLIHVMNLFEEKNKCHMPPPGPLPIKANGAIVVHRPSLHNNLCFSDYEDDDEDDDESNTTSSSLPSSADASLSSDIKEDEELKLLLKENRKLKQKLYADKMKKEKLADDLFFAQQKIRQLERMNQRFEKIILSPKQQTTTRHHVRRQSTNSISHYQAQISSENKIQILLDEIEAMENEAWCCCSHRKGEIIPTDKSTI